MSRVLQYVKTKKQIEYTCPLAVHHLQITHLRYTSVSAELSILD
jgi:hypothetical protein